MWSNSTQSDEEPNFMTHVGQKLALCLIGLFRNALRFLALQDFIGQIIYRLDELCVDTSQLLLESQYPNNNHQQLEQLIESLLRVAIFNRC